MPLVTYAILLFLGMLTPILYEMDADNLSIIGIVLFVIFSIPFAVVTIVTIAQRFGKNLFGNEGYLMFTLPVKTYKLVLSKILCAVFWCVCSVVVYALAWLLLLLLSSVTAGLSLQMLFAEIRDYINFASGMNAAQSINLMIIILIVCFVEIVSLIQLLYFVRTVMNVGFIQKFKGLSGVATFFIVSTITSLVIRTSKEFMPLSVTITQAGMKFSNVNHIEFDFNPRYVSVPINDVLVYAFMFFVLFFLTTALLKKHLAMK